MIFADKDGAYPHRLLSDIRKASWDRLRALLEERVTYVANIKCFGVLSYKDIM